MEEKEIKGIKVKILSKEEFEKDEEKEPEQ